MGVLKIGRKLLSLATAPKMARDKSAKKRVLLWVNKLEFSWRCQKMITLISMISTPPFSIAIQFMRYKHQSKQY